MEKPIKRRYYGKNDSIIQKPITASSNSSVGADDSFNPNSALEATLQESFSEVTLRPAGEDSFVDDTLCPSVGADSFVEETILSRSDWENEKNNSVGFSVYF
jgi:hypothetical protein